MNGVDGEEEGNTETCEDWLCCIIRLPLASPVATLPVYIATCHNATINAAWCPTWCLS